jgi:pyruvate/2-oxoglutarate dehydrogenase complex dihydrolipoamide acyltransferase (E2) component
MTTKVLLPKIGFSMNEGIVGRWMVSNGTQVKQGEPLYELESDKSVQEIESPADGTLNIIADTGITYEVGTVIAEIV